MSHAFLCRLFFKNQVGRQHPVWCNPHENNFWIAKSESLELVCPTAPTPDLSIIPCVLSGLGKFCVVLIMCLQPLPQPPRWQSMPRSDTKWHRITVFCMCFRETLCCQLGLGDWLASQSPKSSWQHPWCQQELPANHKVHHCLTMFSGQAHQNMQIEWVIYGSVHQLSDTMPN